MEWPPCEFSSAAARLRSAFILILHPLALILLYTCKNTSNAVDLEEDEWTRMFQVNNDDKSLFISAQLTVLEMSKPTTGKWNPTNS